MAQVITPFWVHELALQTIVNDDLYLKLFIDDDYTPDSDMEPADFTEAAGGGYAHKTIHGLENADPGPDWTEEANTPRDVIAPEQTFTFSGALTDNATIYGWYLISTDLNTVHAAKLLDTPFQPASGGGTLKFTPRIQAGNGTPA